MTSALPVEGGPKGPVELDTHGLNPAGDVHWNKKGHYFVFKSLENEIFNNFLKKIPILRTIYSAIGQMTETFTKDDKNKKSVIFFFIGQLFPHHVHH